MVGGIYRRMQVSHLKLCASRAFWLVAYPSQGHEMLFGLPPVSRTPCLALEALLLELNRAEVVQL